MEGLDVSPDARTGQRGRREGPLEGRRGDPLEGRRLLITGASSGIGRATAMAARAAGARVALLARSRRALEALATETDGVVTPADVVDAEAVRRAVAAAAEGLGGLDGVVNAAGVARPGPIATTSPSDWQLMFDVNVRGLLHVTQAALPHLLAAEQADIVNVSSMSGRRVGSPEMAVYAASKAAVHALSEGLRREVADDGIRVSVIAPGFVRTGIFDEQDSDAAQRLGRRAREVGLDPRRVADRIVEVLAAPADVLHVEVAMTSVEQ
jgi:NADP-dependent 3-hydroxy acid dehydrogenase YdfG